MNLVAILLLIVAYLLSMILLFFVYRKARRWSKWRRLCTCSCK